MIGEEEGVRSIYIIYVLFLFCLHTFFFIDEIQDVNQPRERPLFPKTHASVMGEVKCEMCTYTEFMAPGGTRS